MILDGMLQYLKACPLLESGRINANYLGEGLGGYTLDTVPAPPVVKTYADGGTMEQALFVFASRAYYGKETRENLAASGFYEQFAHWIAGQNAARILPQLGEGLEPLGVEVLTCGYLFDQSGGTARYQIQLRLRYNKKGVY